MKASLAAFAAAESKRVQCRTCQLSDAVRREVDTGMRSSVPLETISRWLQEVHHLTISADALGSHRKKGHHAQVASS